LINRPFAFPYTPEQLGFPPVSRDGLLKCDEYGDDYEPACTSAGMPAASFALPNMLTVLCRSHRECQSG
jgi:hypothetical protein